ncbi:ABC transporter substrate-binding protein [Nocardioides sp.]|uniref:ABC transporter substrate-binding protein n=1 Tax=Nocardioides sp. TaxID=35761 RepID=UPI0039E32DB3
MTPISRTASRASRIAAVGAAGLLALSLAACSSDADSDQSSTSAKKVAPPPSGDPARVLTEKPAAKIEGKAITLGVMSAQEGAYAESGKSAVEGAKFAAEQINANGGVDGVPIKLVIEDTRGDVSTATNIVRKFATEENVLATVGPLLSNECEASCPVADSLGMPMLAPGVGKPGVVQAAGPHIFHLTAEDCAHTQASLSATIQASGLSTFAIIEDAKDATSTYMAETCYPEMMKKLGKEIITTQTFTTGDQNLSAQVTNLKAKNPDAVFVASGPADAARVAIEMDRQGFHPQILTSGGIQSAGDDYIKAGGKAVEGTIMAAQFDPTTTEPGPGGLIKTYKEETGKTPSLNAAFAYDAVYILVDIIKKDGVTNKESDLAPDRTKIMKGLATQVQGWVGMGGDTTLKEDGDVIRVPQIATVTNGQMVITRPS